MADVRIGGQAVIEGIMMKNKEKYAIAVRKPNKDIEVKIETYKPAADKGLFFRLPIVRGVFNFVESLVIGVKTLTYSASFYDDEEDKKSSSKATNDNTPVTTTNTTGVIYLTFDDGPGSFTNKILDILKKNDIKATFFVTMAGSNDVLRREFDEGHTIGLHTATHVYKQIYASIDSYFDDLNRVSNRVQSITGKETKFIRFPGGTSNHVSAVGMSNIVREVNAKGYTYFDWNLSVEDAGECAYKKDKKTCVVNNFKKYLKPNKVNMVLMHDIKSYTANGLEEMINYAKERNYTFKQIDDSTEPVQFKPYR